MLACGLREVGFELLQQEFASLLLLQLIDHIRLQSFFLGSLQIDD